MTYTADNFANFTGCLITGGAGGIGTSLLSTDTTVHVTTGAGVLFPSVYPFSILIGQNAAGLGEIVQATASGGTDAFTISRHQENTTAQTWPITTPIQNAATAGNYTNIWTAINNGRVFIVEDYGASVASSDNTTAIQNAINAASVNGGIVQFGPGTYITQTLTWYSSVWARGHGIGATMLQLKTGTNADLINGGATNLGYINVTNTSLGAGNNGGLANWGIYDITLDGNKANQSSGTSYCVRIYGLDFILQNVIFQNGYSGGLLVDWNGASQAASLAAMEAKMINCKTSKNNGIGCTWGGPHDSQMTECQFENSGSHGLYVGPHASGVLGVACHSWGPGQGNSSVSMLIEASGTQFTGCVAEGSDTVQLVLLCNQGLWTGGNIYGEGGSPNSTGIQFGQQAGNTPYNGSAYQSAGLTTAVASAQQLVSTRISTTQGTNGALWFANDNGNNHIDVVISIASGSAFTGTLAQSTDLRLTSTTAQVGFLAVAGSLSGVASAVQTPATSGTINTAGYMLAACNPAGNITSVVLQAGTRAGQIICVSNESAFSITFAASGTSNVADGTSDIIATKTGAHYAWDNHTSLWYRCV